MVYRDALAALFTFGGIYAAGVLGWGLFQLGVFGIVAAGVGTVGAWLGGRADRAFGPRPVIVASIWCLIAVCAVALLTTRESVLLVPVPPDSRLPDIVFMAAGGLLGAAAGALQAASRTLLVHQAEGRVAPGAGLRPLRALGQGHRLPRPGADRRRHRRHRLAAARRQPGDPAFPRRPRAAILGQNRQRAAQENPRMIRRMLAVCLALAALAAPAEAQTAKALFGAKSTPSPHDPHPVGQASRGCLAGAVQLPESGPTWQAMRLGRNHHWGHPVDDRLHRGPEPHRRARRLARALRRRHRPGARRARRGPRQPPDRARRRHLVHAAAAARPQPPRPRAAVGDQRARRRPAARERQLDPVARLHPRGGGARPAGQPHLRHRAGQAADVRRRAGRATGAGCARSGPGGTTTTISTCG